MDFAFNFLTVCKRVLNGIAILLQWFCNVHHTGLEYVLWGLQNHCNDYCGGLRGIAMLIEVFTMVIYGDCNDCKTGLQ